MRVLTLFVVLIGCPDLVPPPVPGDPPGDPAETTWTEVDARGTSVRAWDGGDVVVSTGVQGVDELLPELPEWFEGEVSFLARVDGVLFAWASGVGLLRIEDGVATVPLMPDLPLSGLLNPRARHVPFGAAGAGGTTWLATIGGLLRSDDGLTFESVPVGMSGSLNVLFTDVAAFEDEVWAVAQLADSMLPSSFSGLLAGTVFHSADGGETWEEVGDGMPATASMKIVRRASGDVCVASLDAGVWCREGGGWVARSEAVDAVALDEVDGRLVMGLAGGGLMVEVASGWHTTDTAPVVGISGATAMTVDGRTYALNDDFRPTAGSSDGTVHLALSFHVNLYHSYRGDTNDDDGYGQDLRVMRDTLDWLDAHPGIRADWDIENHFSLDGWMQTDGADVLARIQQRVTDGIDDVRLMSWNNGAMASSTRPEFDEAVERGMESLEAAFGRVVPGVQPQENMITPDHLAWYGNHGIEWVTLFYAANGFTGPRLDIQLDGAALYNPVTLADPLGDSLTWMPVYHHADVLDHGGVSAWARQLRRTRQEDVLLAIHFDADAESWENFGGELDAIAEQIDAGEVVPTTIQDYLDDHDTVTTVQLVGDQADGTGDGFQSWAEKDFNHRLATRIVEARTLAQQSGALAGDDPVVADALEAAQTTRLLALSTTHFGLAAPYLAPDRVISAWEFADQAVVLSQAAMDLADAAHPVPAGGIAVTEWRGQTGPSLVEIPLEVAEADWNGVEAIGVYEGTEELAAWLTEPVLENGVWRTTARLVLSLTASEERTLTWTTDDAEGRPGGALTDGQAPSLPELHVPFTECWGAEIYPSQTPVTTETFAEGLVVQRTQTLPIRLCNEDGTVDITQRRYDGLPGVVIEVTGQMADAAEPEDVESIALSPLVCPGEATSIAWRTFAGGWRERPVRSGSDAWNGLSADGAVSMSCADGSTVSVAHRVADRTSLAFAPFRERRAITDQDRPVQAMLAPLGTLWGAGPHHDGRRTGGSGLGEVVTQFVGSQYRPAAADWSGQEIHYRLLVGEDLTPELLDLFAHPPLVRVGP